MNISASSPILLFDSGVGGLSVFAELNRLLPKAPVIYAADLAGLPYGTKTEPQIAARVTGLLGRMAERYKPRLICIACNTASTIALEMVRDVLEVPIVGTVPAIKPAAGLTQTGVIGLLGTEATIRQHYVDNLEAEFAQGKTLLRLAAPDLVQAAEGKLRGEKVDMAVVEDAARRLHTMADGREIDTLVLACTHFPLLGRELLEVFGENVTLLHGAGGIARQIARLVEGQTFDRTAGRRAVMTGNPDDFRRLERVLSTYGIDQIEQF
jgi:glutamate racemase